MPSHLVLGLMTSASRTLFLLVLVLGAPLHAAHAAVQPDSPAVKDENYFNIHEFRVLGNTVLTAVEVERAVYPFLGDHKKLADVEAARTALEAAYHDRGFATVFVDIPEQEISEDIVRLRATEGRIHEMRISGARYFSERRILAALPAAVPGGVPQIKNLQDEIAKVNSQTPDRAVVPVLKAGPVPGTVDIALKVDDHLPLHGSVEINNQSSLSTESLRALYALSYANLFGELDNVSLQYQNTPQDPGQVSVLAGNYTTRPFGNGIRYAFSYIDSLSDVVAVSTLGVLGKGQIYGARVLFPSIDGAPGNQQFTAGVDYKHFQQSIDLTEGGSVSTPISYLNLSLAYAGDWRTDTRQFSTLEIANFGPRNLVNDSMQFADKRYKARPNYFYIRSDSTFSAKLPADFGITARLAGQYAIESLINNEQYSISGINGVRGYLEAESLSDIGINGTLQLTSPPAKWHTLTLGDAFVFYDVGRAAIIDSLEGEPAHQVLRSFGAGLDLFPGSMIVGSVAWAHVLDDATHTRRGDTRILFLVRGAY